MKLEYSLLILAIAFIYGVIKQFAPDFPVPEEYLLLFAAYVLAKLGVEIVGKPLRALTGQKSLSALSHNHSGTPPKGSDI